MTTRPTRREWLGACAGGVAAWGLGAPAASTLGPLLARRREEDARVLVVIELVGGNDGLNTLVPLTQDAYFRARPTLAIAPSAAHRLDDDHGLHPALGGLARLFHQGKLAICHAVGYPRPDRSHFRSREIWHTADREHPGRGRGWLGPLAEALVQEGGGTAGSVHLGSGDLPLALRGGSRLPPSIEGPQSLRQHPAARPIVAWRDRLVAEEASGELGFLRAAARSSYRVAARLERLLTEGFAGDFPPTALARHLALAARLIEAGFPARVYYLRLDGFDTHSRQGPVHAARLAELDGAVSAFQRRLARAGIERRVTTFVFSEFGRRVTENGSRGTDHGAGAPVFLLGAPVRAGLFGTAPNLEELDAGDVPPLLDFRRVYAAIAAWLGAPPPTTHRALPLLT